MRAARDTCHRCTQRAAAGRLETVGCMGAVTVLAETSHPPTPVRKNGGVLGAGRQSALAVQLHRQR